MGATGSLQRGPCVVDRRAGLGEFPSPRQQHRSPARGPQAKNTRGTNEAGRLTRHHGTSISSGPTRKGRTGVVHGRDAVDETREYTDRCRVAAHSLEESSRPSRPADHDVHTAIHHRGNIRRNASIRNDHGIEEFPERCGKRRLEGLRDLEQGSETACHAVDPKRRLQRVVGPFIALHHRGKGVRPSHP